MYAMEQKKPQLMYQCNIFNVWEEEVALPNGKSTKQSMIDHKPTVAVSLSMIKKRFC
jgi:ADP-ribose pyrophosphatase